MACKLCDGARLLRAEGKQGQLSGRFAEHRRGVALAGSQVQARTCDGSG